MSDDIKNLFKKIEELSESNDQVVNLHDNFDIELSEHFVIETKVVGFEHDGVIVEADEAMLEFLDLNGVLLEAEYQGRKVTLNKPMAGDVKKSKVYIKDPKTGNVKKVNFGDKEMRIKKSNPARRKSFRARHKCDTAKDKTTARYWSCRAW
jgi:UDP-2,3-diacylglucosamine pyrophosphatase LpxH